MSNLAGRYDDEKPLAYARGLSTAGFNDCTCLEYCRIIRRLISLNAG